MKTLSLNNENSKNQWYKNHYDEQGIIKSKEKINIPISIINNIHLQSKILSTNMQNLICFVPTLAMVNKEWNNKKTQFDNYFRNMDKDTICNMFIQNPNLKKIQPKLYKENIKQIKLINVKEVYKYYKILHNYIVNDKDPFKSFEKKYNFEILARTLTYGIDYDHWEEDVIINNVPFKTWYDGNLITHSYYNIVWDGLVEYRDKQKGVLLLKNLITFFKDLYEKSKTNSVYKNLLLRLLTGTNGFLFEGLEEYNLLENAISLYYTNERFKKSQQSYMKFFIDLQNFLIHIYKNFNIKINVKCDVDNIQNRLLINTSSEIKLKTLDIIIKNLTKSINI